jgi:hypothetical protein
MTNRRALLVALAKGEPAPKYGGTGGTGVRVEHCCTLKPSETPGVPPLHLLHLENSRFRKEVELDTSKGGTGDEIDERAALAANRVPDCYLDAWARLNHQKPVATSDAQWSRALDDAGRFLDDWGAEAAAMQWSAGELVDIPREGQLGGIVWQLKGERVDALGADHVRLNDGRVIARGGVQRDETKIGD